MCTARGICTHTTRRMYSTLPHSAHNLCARHERVAFCSVLALGLRARSAWSYFTASTHTIPGAHSHPSSYSESRTMARGACPQVHGACLPAGAWCVVHGAWCIQSLLTSLAAKLLESCQLQSPSAQQWSYYDHWFILQDVAMHFLQRSCRLLR